MTESSMRYPAWRAVIACFAMTFFGFGFGFYGHSVYLAALTIRYGSDAPSIAVGTVSTAVTVCYLTAAAIMVLIGDLVARSGRPFAAIGAVKMGVSLFLIARIRTVFHLFVAYLAMAPAFAMLTNAGPVGDPPAGQFRLGFSSGFVWQTRPPRKYKLGT